MGFHVSVTPHGSNFPQQLHEPECATVSSVQMTKSGLIRVPYHDDKLSGNCALNNITSVDFPSRLKVLHTPPQEKPPLTQRAKAILFGKPDTACCKRLLPIIHFFGCCRGYVSGTMLQTFCTELTNWPNAR